MSCVGIKKIYIYRTTGKLTYEICQGQVIKLCCVVTFNFFLNNNWIFFYPSETPYRLVGESFLISAHLGKTTCMFSGTQQLPKL